MNPKIQKLREEYQKNTDKIDSLKDKMDSLKARNKEIEKKITELQNTDILGMIQQLHLTPEQLADLLAENKIIPGSKEDEDHAETKD